VSYMAIALIVFVCVFTSALLTMFFRAMLPHHHLSQDTKDVVNLSMGLIATMAALVLGLLTASAKSSFDQANSGVQQSASNLIQLDHILARYGPETKPIRDRLRRLVTIRINQLWPEEYSPSKKLETPEGKVGDEGVVAEGKEGENMEDAIRKLSPQNEAQREFQSRALQFMRDLTGTRWLLFVEALNPMPKPFLVVLVFWLCLLFAGFGLYAPRNATVSVSFLLCAVAVSSAIFLILEMNQPFEGLIKIPSAPLRYALFRLGQ